MKDKQVIAVLVVPDIKLITFKKTKVTGTKNIGKIVVQIDYDTADKNYPYVFSKQREK